MQMDNAGPAGQFGAISAYVKRFFRRQITSWFDMNRRRLSWRETRDPYSILVAEVLLQQTDASKVSLIYHDFIQRYPNPLVLAEASLEDVRKFISKVGLNYRSQRLIDIAKNINIRFEGRIPATGAELMSLPGVGRYIANAVLSAAFGIRTAVVDTNVVRILERFFGVRSRRSRARTDPEFWNIAHSLLPRKVADCRDWNYALIDFCALVCTHYNPKCSKCVCAEHCRHASTL